MRDAQSWQAKGMILPHHYTQINTWLRGINWPYPCFWFTMCKGLFSWENMGKIDNLWNFYMWSQILTGKRHDTTTPYMKIQTWLRFINWPYLCFWFTMCKGLFSWQNTGKIGNLWNFDVWGPILTGKRHDTTTPLYENPTLAHRHQLAISIFLIPHVQGSFFMRKCRKNG